MREPLENTWVHLAGTHLVPNAFGPSHSVPNNLVLLDKQSPTNLVPSQFGPKKFGPPRQIVPRQFGPQPITSISSHCIEVRFDSYLSGGFTTMAVINPPEKKLAKHTSVHCVTLDSFMN
jgi:hypothetical protein